MSSASVAPSASSSTLASASVVPSASASIVPSASASVVPSASANASASIVPSSSYPACNATIDGQAFHAKDLAVLTNVASLGWNTIKAWFWCGLFVLFVILTGVMLSLESRWAAGSIIIYLFTLLILAFLIADIVNIYRAQKKLEELTKIGRPCVSASGTLLS